MRNIYLLLFLVAMMSVSQAAWWNSTWSSCEQINITNNHPAGYTHRLVLNTSLINYSKTKADLTDLRFLEGNCSSPNITAGVLDMWIQDVNTTGTSNVMFQTVNADITTVAMYHNNSAASSISNATTVAIFGDDFAYGTTLATSPSSWKELYNEVITVQPNITGGELVYNTINAAAYWSVRGPNTYNATSTEPIQIISRMRTGNTTPNGQLQAIGFWVNNTNYFDWFQQKWVGGTPNLIGKRDEKVAGAYNEANLNTSATDTTYREYGILWNGSQANLTINGISYGTRNINPTGWTPSLKVQTAASNGNADYRYDYYFVMKYILPVPTYSFGPEEDAPTIPSTSYWVPPTPSNGSTSYSYSQSFTFNATSNISNCFIEVDGINKTGTVTNSSCSYLPYDTDYIYNNTYALRGFANISGSWSETNETRYFTYLGCGYLNHTDVITADLLNNDPNYPTCIKYNASNVVLDCAGYNLTSMFGHAIGFNGNLDNTTTRNCIFDDQVSYVDPLNAFTINGSYHNFSNISIVSPTAILLDSPCTSITGNTFENISCSYPAVGCMLNISGDSFNTVVSRFSDGFIGFYESGCPGGNATVTDSSFQLGGAFSNAYKNITFSNVTLSNQDYAAYEDSYKTTLRMDNMTFHDSGYGIRSEIDMDAILPTYAKNFSNLYFKNMSSSELIRLNASSAATATIYLDGVIIDDVNGGLVNYSNITQSIYIADMFTNGQYWLNQSTNQSVPANHTLFGQVLTMTTSGYGSGETTFHWLDSQLGSLNESHFVIAVRNAGAWSIVNNTPDTVNNELYMAFADPWTGGDYALLEAPEPSLIFVNLTSPANGSIFTTPVNLTWLCYGDFSWYDANVTLTNFTGLPALYPTSNFTNTTVSFGFSPSNGAYHTWNVTCSNGSKSNYSTDGYFITDLVGPNITIHTPSNSTYNTTSILVNISATDVYSTIDAIWFSNGSGTNVSYTIPTTRTFVQGSNTLTVWSNDSRGNLNSTNVTFFVDSIPPSIVINTPQNTSYNSSSVLVNITASDTNLDTVWFWNGTDNETYAAPVAVTYTDGSHTLQAWANDTGGNVVTASITFLTDATPPVMSYQFYTDADGTNRIDWPTSWVAFNVAASDATSGLKNMTTRIYQGGVLWQTVTQAASPIIRNYTIMAGGLYTFNATAYDNVGNEQTLASRSVNITLYSGPTAALVFPLVDTHLQYATIQCGGFGPFNGSIFMDGAYVNSTTCLNGIPCTINFPLQDCKATTVVGQCSDGFGFTVNTSSSTYRILPDYSGIISPANGITGANGTNITFVMNWSCTPASTDVQIATVPILWPMNCTGLLCSYTNDTWSQGYHLWSIRTGLLTGGYVFSPSFNFMIPMTHWSVNSTVILNKTYTYTEFTNFNIGFFEDYGAFFLGILAYALAWLMTQRYPQTLISGGIGMFFVYLLTGNAAALIMSIISVIFGLAFKYSVG